MLPTPSRTGSRLRPAVAHFIGRALALISLSVVIMCSSPQGGGESHTGTFVGLLLTECSSANSCAAGSPVTNDLQCTCLVCTTPCVDVEACRTKLAQFADSALNTALTAHLVCRQIVACSADQGAPVEGEGVCDVECAADEDCKLYGSEFSCVGGYCRRQNPTNSRQVTKLHCPKQMLGLRSDLDGKIGDFCVDAFEVTVRDYKTCVTDGICADTMRGNAFVDGREDYPIDWVSPTDANDYCSHLGKRVPTRTEWQWAAQNGSALTAYPWGDSAPRSTDAPPRVCALGTTESCSVGSFPSGRTSSQIADLAGNVAEIVQDGAAFCVAGGSFADSDSAALESSSCMPFEQSGADIGFRCVAAPL